MTRTPVPGAGVAVMAARRRLGLTMTELGQRAGCSRQSLHWLEYHDLVPTKGGIADRLAKVLTKTHALRSTRVSGS